MTKKTTRKTLKLETQTLRLLETEHLPMVAGGGSLPPKVYGNATAYVCCPTSITH